MNYKPGNAAVKHGIPTYNFEGDYQLAGAGRAEFKWVRDRVGGGGEGRAPAERLIELNAIREAADELLRLEVRRLRHTARWATWERLGDLLGMTKQGAAQRFGGSS